MAQRRTNVTHFGDEVEWSIRATLARSKSLRGRWSRRGRVLEPKLLKPAAKRKPQLPEYFAALRERYKPSQGADSVGNFSSSGPTIKAAASPAGPSEPRSRGSSKAMHRDCLAGVAETAAWVAAQAQHVRINPAAVEAAAAAATPAELDTLQRPQWDTEVHFRGGDAATAQYLLVLDALNFCFWPQPGLEYEHLARGLKESLAADAAALDAERLAAVDGPGLQVLLRRCEPLPLQEERARLLREVGAGLLQQFDGQAARLIAAANGSAAQLVQLVTAAFPGFRDHAVYRGRQVFLYKRAQIFVADVWGAFGGSGLGAFRDIGRLTTFADYRVPVVLRQLGVLQYADDLAAKVDSKQQILAGSELEVEIRACTIAAVDMLRRALDARLTTGAAGGSGPTAKSASSSPAAAAATPAAAVKAAADGFRSNSSTSELHQGVMAVAVDWWLWGRGEAERDTAPPHHRTLTVYY